MLCGHAACSLHSIHLLIPSSLYQKELSTDLDDMLNELQQAEKDLGQFNAQQVKDRLPLIDVIIF